jgi:aminoglycoside phosphotransferase (APT) family kinase protein
MESKTKNRKTRREIAAMVARAFGGVALAEGEGALRELKDGWFNAAYEARLADGRAVILKIAPPPGADVLGYEQNLMATEVAVMRLVGQSPAIPTPEIAFFDSARDLCDSDYFFMQKVAGENLEHVRAQLDPETRASVERQIGAIIRAVNGFAGTYFGYEGNPELRAATWPEAFIKIVDSVLADGARKSVVYDYSYDELRATVVRHAPALEQVATPRLVHWDAWDSNFFVRDGRIAGIIDFERALWADPLMEAQFRPLSFGAGVTDAMRGYGKTAFSAAEERRCYLYTLHLALVMNTECFYRNYDSDSVYASSRQLMGGAMEWLRAR